MSKQANPLDSIARWTPPQACVPNPKPSRASREKAKAEKRESVEQIKRDANAGSKPKRVGVPARLDRLIRERDSNTCQVCGLTVGEIRADGSPVKAMHVDHIVPVASGGSSTDDTNLRCACEKCNGGKGARTPTPEEAAQAAKWRAEKDAECQARIAIVKKPKPLPPPPDAASDL